MFFLITNQFATVSTKSVAGFGQGTLNLSDNLRAIAGVRYTSEEKSVDGFDIGANDPIVGGRTFNKWTWRAGLEYDLTPDNMLYATASRGFVAGGFNNFSPTPAVTNQYEPETITSYVVDARNRFFDNTVQFNVEAFYWDYKDKQC